MFSVEDGIGYRNWDYILVGEESYVKNRKGSVDSFERFLKEIIDLIGILIIIN